MKSKTFPIMAARGFDKQTPKTIPWAILKPHAKQAEINHHQTLERLAERGGLAPDEAVAIIEDRPWAQMGHQDALDQLLTIIEENKICTGCGDAIKAGQIGQIVTMLGEKFYFCVECTHNDSDRFSG